MALDGGEKLTSCPSYFTPEKQIQHPLNRKLGGLKNQSGCSQE